MIMSDPTGDRSHLIIYSEEKSQLNQLQVKS